MSALPAGFEALVPYLGWALETEAERSVRRGASRFEDVKAFYDATYPLLPQALDHLKAHPLEGLPGPSRSLLLLLLSYAEAALVVENFGEVRVTNGFGIENFEGRLIGGTF